MNRLTLRRSILKAWTAHRDRWKTCRDCPLCEDRREVALVRGCLPASILFMGEGPGAAEDAGGWPFIGPAGAQWDAIYQEALANLLEDDGLDGSEVRVALANIVGCRPVDDLGNNRAPSKKEAVACRPRVLELLEMAQPKVLVLMGRPARTYFPQEDLPEGVQVLETLHPSAVLQAEGADRDLRFRKMVSAFTRGFRKALGEGV